MYFIIEGSVDIITTDNKRVLKTLSKGDFVGEMALMRNARRACSVICHTFCLIYILKKTDFVKIIGRYANILKTLSQVSLLRTLELPKEPIIAKPKIKRRNTSIDKIEYEEDENEN